MKDGPVKAEDLDRIYRWLFGEPESKKKTLNRSLALLLNE
jgi:hypothetical protein